MDTGAEIILAVTSERLRAEVERLAGPAIGSGLTLVTLGLRGRFARLAERLLGRWLPVRRFFMLRDNLGFFRSLDLLVVAEKTSLRLKRLPGLHRLRIVHTRHGAGDRAIGFERSSRQFDRILVAGPKIRDRLVDDAGVDPTRIAIVGYPKFDLHAETRAKLPWDERDRRPIVLYNPHPSPHLSSWYRFGPAVLDWFVAHPEYRLLFAPHVMLFERSLAISIDRFRVARPGRIEPRWRKAENILVDTGSRETTTMAYTNAADIYLGDASSQVYEFLLRPRPCLFLDAHRTRWEGDANFAHWRAGPVIDDVRQLGTALTDVRATFETRWKPAQQALFAHSFDLTAEPSALRAARVIADFASA